MDNKLAKLRVVLVHKMILSHYRSLKRRCGLAYRLFFSTLLLFLITVSNLSAALQKQIERGKAKVASYQLHVEERSGKCILSYEGPYKGEISMTVPPPCEFVRDHTGAAQHFRYKNRRRSIRGYFEVILIVGGPTEKSRSDRLMKEGCGTQTQAVSLSSRGVVAGAVGSGVLVCPTDGLDEKFFGSLAKPK
jgi:hypothetical protein